MSAAAHSAVPLGRFIVHPRSETSFGHRTMAHPKLARRRVHALAWRRSAATQLGKVKQGVGMASQHSVVFAEPVCQSGRA
jgi:hypothetical protein